MVYESQISFTLDTICPWTYLAKRRLDIALEKFRASEDAKDVNFTVKYFPYQLYPDASQEGEDKHDWYIRKRYNNNEDQMKKYETVMSAEGLEVGIPFRFDGTIANTTHAHRVIQYFQESKGPEIANKIINDLYGQYFTQAKHPSSRETLMHAVLAAGIPEDEAKKVIEDDDEGLVDMKMLEREQRNNGIDAVPNITLEGKRRDINIEGARTVEEFGKELQKIAKESK